MTEVDAVLPEGISSVPNSNADAHENHTGSKTNSSTVDSESKTTSTEKLHKDVDAEEDTDKAKAKVVTTAAATTEKPDKADDCNSNHNENSNGSSNSNHNSTENKDVAKPTDVQAMEVDGDDTEEDDSQLTTSTENKLETPTVDDEEEEEETSTTNGEHVKATPVSTNENSVDTADPLEEAEPTKSTEDAEKVESKSNNRVEEDNSQQSESKTAPTTDTDGADEDSRLSDKPEGVEDSQDSTSNGPAQPVSTNGNNKEEHEPMDLSEAPEVLETPEKENGVASKAETKAAADPLGVVNLDDSDDEMDEEAKQPQQQQPPPLTAVKSTPQNENSNGATSLPVISQVKTISESDDAVLIGSDSEPENAGPPVSKTPIAPTNLAPPTPMVEDDDDDDDCVVIEDDTPAPTNDALKRKNGLDNDDFPPSKRQRSLTPATNVGQLTIKDARSLMPQDANAVKKDGIYPVTITPATTGLNAQGPPKLVPMTPSTNALINTTATNLSFAGLPSMTNNANLLPGLTDDMFVLEAPSFIVPYIYEKPPTDNIKEIVKAIEAQYALTAEDLAEADKTDEFDMTTEQNKDEKQAEEAAKKKKKNDDNDDSWSEQSEEDDDDDDDSESGMRTKVLIKEATDDLTALKGAIKPSAAVTQSGGAPNPNFKPGQENYFESPLGKFFMDIGVGLVQEFVQSDLLRLQKRKLRKSLSRDTKVYEGAINALSGNLQASKEKNAPFKFTMKRCEFCNFKSESALAMANHYETPHMNGVMYKCNFCTFEIRNATEIVYHMEAMHNIKARLIKPLPYHQCPNCGFEDNGKAKLARHQPVCAKKFRPEMNLSPPTDWEAPAKIPRIKPRHGLVGTATAYQAMAAQAAAQKAALATIQAQQAQAAQARNLQAAALAAQNAAKMRARTPNATKPVQNINVPPIRNQAPLRNPISTNVVLPNNYQIAAGQLVQQATKKTIGGQPSISITPLPRQNTAVSGSSGASSSKIPPNTLKPGQSPSGANSKAQFVICEICDGYIKDLEQLRNHMQWMHKVKIHPKMIYNRPPLNCQKCQFRFFTDQGLERHLLGSHGLVTSSMQEAANKGKDAGRCPICGRMYQWKLLNHVSRDHHMTLKPAHLSYKCTVCTATFGMYKQFETHVYTAHSSVAKKAMDNKKAGAPTSSSNSAGPSLPRNSLGTNDSLLKPLKINDEITIIPQPASKPRITNMESHVID